MFVGRVPYVGKLWELFNLPFLQVLQLGFLVDMPRSRLMVNRSWIAAC